MLTKEIKVKALELGFCEIGIARVEELRVEGDRLAGWLARGYHGTMEWMGRNFEKRVDPRNILPGAKSMICVALNYYTDIEHSRENGVGKISRYAWGDDYHDVMKRKLDDLLHFIVGRKPGVRGRVYVDTGPVLDKVWAQRAGIGWQGKHTNVITRKFGSWVFLGEVIVDVELVYDPPATDHCGSCTLCIEACPTDAIVEPYVLDSNLCISYLTIEHRGGIRQELGEKFDNWIYGCDICQDVCPWNKKFAQPTAIREFYPREGNDVPELGEWRGMTPEQFSRRFRGSPVKRTKLQGLVRNVLTVLNSIKSKIPT